MPKRVACLGATFSTNLGASAMLTGFINAIRSREPNIEIEVITVFPTDDIPEAKRLGVTLVDGHIDLITMVSRLFKALARRVGGHLIGASNDPLINSIEHADLIVDLSGDSFTEDYGVSEVVASIVDILLVKILRRKIVIYAQSIGPFYNPLLKIIATKCLDRVDLLLVRESISEKYLHELGVKKRIDLVGDAALLMEPAVPKRAIEILSNKGFVEANRPVVGLSVSQHLYQKGKGKGEAYIRSMVDLVNHLTDDLGAQVVIISHVSSDRCAIDDCRVGEIILKEVNSPTNILLLKGKYRADELKAVISKMDMFVGSRMHANIAALSTHVPVLALSYSHKTEGIMGLLGLGDWVISANNMNQNALKEKVDLLWSCRDEVRHTLINEEPKVKDLAWHGMDLTLALLNEP